MSVDCGRDNQLQLENDLSATPFHLASGEVYRDLLTITAARSVGQFGVARNRTSQKIFKPRYQNAFNEKRMTTLNNCRVSHQRLKASPKFEQRYHSEPVYQSDREIFDFTDSRFIQPFPENSVNYPYVLDVSNDLGIGGDTRKDTGFFQNQPDVVLKENFQVFL